MSNQDFFKENQKEIKPEAKYYATAYTDGATAFKNPDAGGFGIILCTEKDGFRYIKTVSISYPLWAKVEDRYLRLAKKCKTRKPVEKDGVWCMETTNNRMEIGALIEAMKRIKKPGECCLTLVSDSQWALNMTEGKWRAKENLDLVTEARNLVKDFHEVQFEWTKGHVGHRWNEWCDTLAGEAAKGQFKEAAVKTYKEKCE